MSDATIKIPARVVVELHADGTLSLETYKNGARHRLPLSRGGEWYEVMLALREKRAEIDDDAARKAAKQAKDELSRHRRVWTNVAADHGTGFAIKTVGHMAGVKLPKLGISTHEDLL